jgi:butyryl-CoA dehydrogenase
MPNPLIDEKTLDFVLHDVVGLESILALPRFAEHDRAVCDATIDSVRRYSREVLFPAYRILDAEPPVLRDGRALVHPRLQEIWPGLRDLGLISAGRSTEIGGQQLPFLVTLAAILHIQAANCPLYSFLGLTTGAAHLIETFGSEALKERYLPPLLDGTWTGTMALTEPQAGSSLADIETRATPSGDHHLVSGSKIFISGGDHDLTENIVHMVLARIDGAPPGVKGISLFLVPKLRPEGGCLVPNDVKVAGLIHKIGWRGLPAAALNFGEEGGCHGWLVGEPHRGLAAMFQMMNEARIIIGGSGVATASVAYQESLAYARTRPQGRSLTNRDASSPQVPITEHADVRRMLLRQKAIVEGGLALLFQCARLSDLADHAEGESKRRAQLLLDLLTPLAKSFPAEKGFESTVLALQVHGGYGYSSEYLPEAFLRDQKLNSIHEGTTGIQGLDLLGRKVVMEKGAALRILGEEVAASCARATKAGVDPAWIAAVGETGQKVGALTGELARRGQERGPEAMLLHSADYLDLFSSWVVAWQWLEMAAVAKEALAAGRGPEAFYAGKVAAAEHWIRTEMPKAQTLIAICREGEESYRAIPDEGF